MEKIDIVIKIQATDKAEAELRAAYLRECNEFLTAKQLGKITSLLRNSLTRIMLLEKLK